MIVRLLWFINTAMSDWLLIALMAVFRVIRVGIKHRIIRSIAPITLLTPNFHTFLFHKLTIVSLWPENFRILSTHTRSHWIIQFLKPAVRRLRKLILLISRVLDNLFISMVLFSPPDHSLWSVHKLSIQHPVVLIFKWFLLFNSLLIILTVLWKLIWTVFQLVVWGNVVQMMLIDCGNYRRLLLVHQFSNV